MCRILAYLGKPIVIDDLLYKPDNSFIKQSYNPQYMSQLLNLAGFGMVAWDQASYNPSHPFIYKTPNLPFYDENLRNLTRKITPSCLLAHLRGVTYSENQVVTTENVHPFIFDNTIIALAHNGALMNFDKMKYHLTPYINPKYLLDIHGTTDSEWIYAILLSNLPNSSGDYTVDEISKAIIETLKILHRVRQDCEIATHSPVNLFISNGKFIAVTRFVFDYGWQPQDATMASHFSYHSLWYTYGESYGYYDNEYRMKSSRTKSSIIISSEPLTSDAATWISVPEYTLVIASLDDNEIKIISHDIDI